MDEYMLWLSVVLLCLIITHGFITIAIYRLIIKLFSKTLKEMGIQDFTYKVHQSDDNDPTQR
jgi:hypothetical protein